MRHSNLIRSIGALRGGRRDRTRYVRVAGSVAVARIRTLPRGGEGYRCGCARILSSVRARGHEFAPGGCAGESLAARGIAWLDLLATEWLRENARGSWYN